MTQRYSRGSLREMRHGQPFEFAWPVAEDHQWIDGKVFDSTNEPQSYLVPAGMRLKVYKPLESATGLFRDFSQLERTQGAFREFANAYGMLGALSSLIIPTNTPQFAVASIGRFTARGKKKQQPMVPRAESLDFWAEQVSAMNQAVRLWTALNSAVPQDELSKFIEWRDETSVMYHHFGEAGEGWEWIATRVHHPELLTRLQYPDLLQPAQHQLQRLVNRQLEKEKLASCPQLLWDHGRLLLFIQPQSLIGAMWLQFALAIDGERQYLTCPGCGRWFEIGSGRMRADAQTCSPTCRQRKKRKAEKQKTGRARHKARKH